MAMRWTVVGVVMAVAGDAEAAPIATIGQIELNAQPYLHGAPPGTQQFGFVMVQNTGDQPLLISDVALSGPGAAVFAFQEAGCTASDCPQAVTVPPNNSLNLPVACTAPQFGDTVATVTVTSNIAPATASIACTGLRPPTVAITPASLDFGRVHACNPYDGCGASCDLPTTRTVTITNTAAAPSELLFLDPVLDDDWVFAGAGCSPQYPCVLESGQSYTYELRFAPKSTSGPSWLLDLSAPQPGQPPITVPVQAIGGWGRLDVTDGQVVTYVGPAPVNQTTIVPFTVKNIGDACIEVETPFLIDNNLSIVDGDPQWITLEPGESYSWRVACTPHSIAGVSASFFLEYMHHLVDFHNMIMVCEGTGSALAPEVPELDLGTAVPAGGSATQRVHVRNVFDQPIDLLTATPSDPHFTVVPVTGALPATLDPNAELELAVTFTPTDTTAVTAMLVLHASAGDDAMIALSGRGAPREEPPPDPDPEDDHDSDSDSGCATSSPALLLGLWALALRRRRR